MYHEWGGQRFERDFGEGARRKEKTFRRRWRDNVKLHFKEVGREHGLD
jgi:hypothetical protein